MAVNADLVVRSPAIAAASAVGLEFERCWALVLAALNLGTCRLQVALAEAVLHRIHDRILLEELQARPEGYRQEKAGDCNCEGLHCSGWKLSFVIGLSYSWLEKSSTTPAV